MKGIIAFLDFGYILLPFSPLNSVRYRLRFFNAHNVICIPETAKNKKAIISMSNTSNAQCKDRESSPSHYFPEVIRARYQAKSKSLKLYCLN